MAPSLRVGGVDGGSARPALVGHGGGCGEDGHDRGAGSRWLGGRQTEI